MRLHPVLACLLAAGCAGRREAAPRDPALSSDWRCTLRISRHGTFADGERMSRADAVEHCKRTASAAVVVIDDEPRSAWDATAGVMLEIEDRTTKLQWDETRSALERAGIHIYVRGRTCAVPGRDACIRRLVPNNDPPLDRRPYRATELPAPTK